MYIYKCIYKFVFRNKQFIFQTPLNGSEKGTQFVERCVALCCSVLQCAAVCCSVLPCVAVC